MFGNFMTSLGAVTAPATRFVRGGQGGTPEPVEDNPFATLRNTLGNEPLQEPEPEDVLYAEYIRDIWMDEDQKRAPMREKSRVAWEYYHNYYAADDLKDDWQSKKKFPLMAMTVERIVAAISRLRENNPKWFEIDSIIPNMQIYSNLSRNLLDHWLSHDSVKFSSKFKELIKSGLLNTQMAVQVVFETNGEPLISPSQSLEAAGKAFFDYADLAQFVDNPGASDDFPFIPNPNMPKLRIEVIDPIDLLVDSSGSNEWKMWRTYHTAGQLLDFVDSRGYDHEACKRAILAGPSEMEMHRAESNQRKGKAAGKYHGRNAGQVVLTHFEGTLTDPKDGLRVFRNKYMVVANGEVVLKPQPIRFWDGEGSIVAANFQSIPHSTSGKSIMTDSLDAFQSRHDLTNLLLDFFNLTLMGVHEMDTDLLDKEEEPPTSLFPSMLVRTKKRGQSQSAIQPIAMADLPQGFWQFMQFFQQQFSEYTGMTQELMGMPRTRGRITGMEYQARTSESGGLMAHFFEDIESNFLAPMLRLAFLRILQDTPDKMWEAWVLSNKAAILPKSKTDPKLLEQWSKALDECAKWTAKERFIRLGSYFRFRVRIFSSQMERQAEIEQMIYFLQNLAKVPSALQLLRMEKFIPELASRFGLDPEQMLRLEAVPTPPGEAELAASQLSTGDIEDVPFDLMGGANSMFDQAMQGMSPPDMLGGGSASPFPGYPADQVPNQAKPPGGM